jgi:protein gp37
VKKTKIDWCDMSWNPVTGCLHGCEYCYAKRIAERFGILENPCFEEDLNDPTFKAELYVKHDNPYPYIFSPTFHKYRLDEPQKVKKSQRIFVCSMADLFGDWVPDSWIEEVIKACEAAPQHKYLFLTKNPKRYSKLAANNKLPPQHWYGHTVTGQEQKQKQLYSNWRTFVSIEPLLSMPDLEFVKYDNTAWVIIGQQTGPGAKPPKQEWVESIIEQCRAAGVPVLIKSPLYKQFPIQEYPEGLEGER